MHLSKAQLGNFIYKLDTATSFQSLFSALEVLVNNIGVNNIIYSFIPSLALDFKKDYKPIFKASNSNDDTYITHYLETRLDLHDYAIKRMKHQRKNKVIAIDWWHEVCKQPFIYKKSGGISIKKSRYFRTNGITFPTLSDPTGLAVVSFIFNEKNCLYTQLKSKILNDLELLSREFHRHVVYRRYQESIFTKPLLKRFSATEDKVFKKLLLSGESANYIASEIGISAKGVENAIRRLRVKLAGETPEGLPRISKNNLIRYGSLMGVENWLR